MSKLSASLRSRTARNIYFWVIAILFIFDVNSHADTYPKSVYLSFKACSIVLLFILTWLNNFVIVPKTMGKRRYALYIVSALALVLAFGALYVLIFKVMLHYYPGIEVYEVSILTSPVTTDWSAATFIQEVLSFAFGLLIWVVVFTMAWYMNAYTEKEKQVEKAKKKQLETELRLLRNQLNPHFLFNTLNNIYGLALKKSDKAPDSILQLSSIMRYVLYDANAATMPYEKEKEVMNAYIDMELLRLQQKENVAFYINADDNYKLPPLLWLPILENAFKYATRVITDNYFIDYHFSIENGVLTIRSSNSYKEGVDKQLNAGGLGLNNLHKRLSILYSGKYQLKEKKENGVYSIDLTISLV